MSSFATVGMVFRQRMLHNILQEQDLVAIEYFRSCFPLWEVLLIDIWLLNVVYRETQEISSVHLVNRDGALPTHHNTTSFLEARMPSII